uniref:UPAR/Ly6 domain-containing protein qvr n=1 Tax=Steinernema glaseri TaxID=37863 RepID=A0A1I7Z433_9BILA
MSGNHHGTVPMWFLTITALLSLSLQVRAELRTIRCYSCTTMDADRLLEDVQDPNWRQWLDNVRFVPNTKACNDDFVQAHAIRSGVRSQECENGVCMKMWFKEKNGNSQVWRSCIPKSQEQIRSDCTRISSSQGDMEVCTCDGNLCNFSSRPSLGAFVSITAVLSLFRLL